MKKTLLSIAMVLMLASPAVAGTPTVIDDVGRNLESVTVDDHIYLPLRTFAEIFGMEIQWDGTFVRINSVKRPVILGDDKYKTTVSQALDLLQAKDPVDYEMICKHTKEIIITTGNIDTEWGEAYAYSLGNGIFEVSPKLLLKSSAYIAGNLVHEATHLANNSPDRILSENIAYYHQITVLHILGESQQEIDAVEATRQRAIK